MGWRRQRERRLSGRHRPATGAAAVRAAAVLLLGLQAAALAGCAATSPPPSPAMSRAEFEQGRAALSKDRDVRDAVAIGCRQELGHLPPRRRDEIGAVLDLDSREVVPVFCDRLIAAIVRGDLSYADFEQSFDEDPDPQVLRRVLRALRIDADAQSI